MADGVSHATESIRVQPGLAQPRIAVAVTPLRPKTSLKPLIEALADQVGVDDPCIAIFAAAGDRLAAAAAAFEAVGEGALALHLIEGESAPTAAVDCRKVLEAAAYHLQRHGIGDDPVLLVIDSRAVPAPDWIAANLRALGEGADLVCGKPIPRSGAEHISSSVEAMVRYRQLAVRLEELIDPVAWDPWPRHGDDSGTSMAFRLSYLEAAGGVPDVPAELPRHLMVRLRQAGGFVRHCPGSRVFVPPHLLADRLAEGRISNAKSPMPVTDPADLEASIRYRRWLRGQLDRQHAGLEPAERGSVVRSLLALETSATPAAFRARPVEQACAILRARVEELDGTMASDRSARRPAVTSLTRWIDRPRVF